jgi:hypothetical protein
MPKAVPRRLAGAVSAMSVARMPCVKPDHQRRDCIGIGQHAIGPDQKDKTGDEHADTAEPVGQGADGIGREAVDDVHDHQYERNPGDR